jgi:dolichol-phosphate mannosyltransferase
MRPFSELLVVMPVFNEEASIEKVVRDWFSELDRQVGSFVLLAIDDGSTDGTHDTLRKLAAELDERLEVVSRPNKGHGQTCLEGYRKAYEGNVPYILQVDSDGQCDPIFFQEFWSKRTGFDVVYGQRQRADGFRRTLASWVLRWMLRIGFLTDCVDPNVPYRLMKTTACAGAFQSIPEDFFLANVALSLLLKRNPGIRQGVVAIRFLERTGGEPSVPFTRFAFKAFELFRQLKSLDCC